VASIPSLPIELQGLLLARIRKSKLLIDVRDLWSDSLSTTKFGKIPFLMVLNRFAEKMLYRRADLITCTSRAQAEGIRKMVGDAVPICNVPNSLDPELKDTATEIHPLIHEIRETYGRIGVFAGKHTRYAALGTLLAAAKELEINNFALLFVGGGYTKLKLRQRVRTEKIKNVFFHDPVPKKEIASFMLGADIFFTKYSKEQAWISASQQII